MEIREVGLAVDRVSEAGVFRIAIEFSKRSGQFCLDNSHGYSGTDYNRNPFQDRAKKLQAKFRDGFSSDKQLVCGCMTLQFFRPLDFTLRLAPDSIHALNMLVGIA